MSLKVVETERTNRIKRSWQLIRRNCSSSQISAERLGNPSDLQRDGADEDEERCCDQHLPAQPASSTLI